MTSSSWIWIAIALVPASALAHVGSPKQTVGRELGRADLARTELAQSARKAVSPLKKKGRQAPAPASAFPSFTLDVSDSLGGNSDDAPISLTRTQ